MSATSERRANGILVITIEAGDEVTIRAASMDVRLDEASNMYAPPRSDHDYDQVSVRGRRRDPVCAECGVALTTYTLERGDGAHCLSCLAGH